MYRQFIQFIVSILKHLHLISVLFCYFLFFLVLNFTQLSQAYFFSAGGSSHTSSLHLNFSNDPAILTCTICMREHRCQDSIKIILDQTTIQRLASWMVCQTFGQTHKINSLNRLRICLSCPSVGHSSRRLYQCLSI
jgi:hypothetical protein